MPIENGKYRFATLEHPDGVSAALSKELKSFFSDKAAPTYKQAGVITGLFYSMLNSIANGHCRVTLKNYRQILIGLRKLDSEKFDPIYWLEQFAAEDWREFIVPETRQITAPLRKQWSEDFFEPRTPKNLEREIEEPGRLAD